LSVAPRTPSSVEKDAQQLAAQIGYEQVRFYWLCALPNLFTSDHMNAGS